MGHGQSDQGLKVGKSEHLVQQHPNPNSAPRSVQQLVQHQPAGVITSQDEILQLNAFPGCANEVDANHERGLARIEQSQVVCSAATVLGSEFKQGGIYTAAIHLLRLATQQMLPGFLYARINLPNPGG
jgi:hypothetical protein